MMTRIPLVAPTFLILCLSSCGPAYRTSPGHVRHDDLYRKPPGVATRWASFENPAADKGGGGLENQGAKGHAFDSVDPGETKTLLDIEGAGAIRRIWMTLNPQDSRMLRSLRLDMYWENAATPAVSVPLGDLFGVAVGKMSPFENALFSSPEAKSFNCNIPMPFREGARVTLTNESDRPVKYLFYDIDFTLGDHHPPDMLYFHAHWRRQRWTTLGDDFEILPRVSGEGRFLGCNVGVLLKPGHAGWWGEGEVKAYIDGDAATPTLVGTGLEDYIGAAWGLGAFVHRYQGCPVAEPEAGRYAFYRYHIPDPIYFDEDCRVTIQQMGGGGKAQVLAMLNAGLNIQPVTVIPAGEHKAIKLLEQSAAPRIDDPAFPGGWVNYYREDDYSATALFYLDSPTNSLPPLAALELRLAGFE